MPFRTINKHELHIQWPRLWIFILGMILLFLCFCIAGMEVGHTLADVYRSTAFGGFILFLPLLTCAILILTTAFKPRVFLLRIATTLCFIIIILCMVLIAYDILILIDPTQCYFLSCSNAVVNASNSTTNVVVTGWPLTITWPSYFQANMNAKRIFQSIQLLCASLFILFTALYILTYFIYRNINFDHQLIYKPDRHSNDYHREITTYSLEGGIPASPVPVQTIIRAKSVNYDRICTRCLRKPRMVLLTIGERQEYFSHLCLDCNNEILHYRHKGPLARSADSSVWKP